MSQQRPPDAPDEDAAEAAREQAEWAELQREANAIDPERYRKRSRVLKAIALGAFGAGLAFATITLFDKARNPCERVRDYLCRKGAESPSCEAYQAIFKESVDEESPKMRSAIRQQCETKIERLAEEGMEVP